MTYDWFYSAAAQWRTIEARHHRDGLRILEARARAKAQTYETAACRLDPCRDVLG